MPSKYGTPDAENPEWTADDLREAQPARDVIPWAFPEPPKRRRGERGPQKAPTKEQITLRLSRDVVDAYRRTGRGWQARIDATLRNGAKKLARKPARKRAGV